MIVDLATVDDETMRIAGWARTRRGPVGDHCPPDGWRTLRAEHVADVLRGSRPQDADADLVVMDSQQLCRECGYPLDKTCPYPAVR